MKSSVLSEEAKLGRTGQTSEEDRAAVHSEKNTEKIEQNKKTDIKKCKQRWPWDVIKKNSMSRPHGSETYCYLEAAGVIACEHRDDIHQFGGFYWKM